MIARPAVLIAAVAVVTMLVKGGGPALVGARPLPAPLLRVVTLLAPPLLAALVVTSALANGSHLHVGADTAGVAVAVVLLVRGAGVLPAVLVAAVVTALVRLL